MKLSDEEILYHTFRIDFPVRRAVGGSVEVVLYLSTAKQLNIGDLVYVSDSIGVQLLNCDELVYDFDDREFLFALGQLEIKVLDKEENLKRILFNHQSADYENDKCYLKFRPFDNSGDVIFEGYLELESLHYDKKSKEISMSFIPNTAKLNKSPLWINGTFNDLMPGLPSFGAYWLLSEVIKGIYKIINPAVEVEIKNNWVFRPLGSVNISENFSQLYVNYFRYMNSPNENYGDMIKMIARSFGCFTGMVSNERAIVKPFKGKASEVIDVTERLVQYEEMYSRNELKFVKLNYRGITPPTAGIVTSIESEGISFDCEAECFLVLEEGNPYSTEIVFNASSDGGISFAPIPITNVNYLANYFLNIESAKKDKIVIKGYGVEIYNDVKVEEKYYRPLSVVKKLREGITEIEAVPISFIFEDYDVSEPVELPPSGGVIGNNVIGEELRGESFTEGGTIIRTAYEFVEGSTRLYRNGIRQKLSEDYNELEGNHSVVLVEPMNEEEILLMDYTIKN